MPNDRKILKNVVNNDTKVLATDAKSMNAETKASKIDTTRAGVYKAGRVTMPGRVPKKDGVINEEKNEKATYDAIISRTSKTSISDDAAIAISTSSDSSDSSTSQTNFDDLVLAIDEGDEVNAQLMSEYASGIYEYLHVLEQKYAMKTDFMAEQKEITPRMRSILINWLVQVHTRFHLLHETLFYAVSMLDRYMERAQIAKPKFQLVGITALWVASKVEEILVAPVEDYLYVTDNAYNKGEIEAMELAILMSLDFQINKPLPIHFLRRFSKAGMVDVNIHNLAKYLTELSLSEYQMASIPSSILAAASLYLSRKIYDEDAFWTKNLTYHSTYSEADILPTVSRLAAHLLKLPPSNKFTAVQQKYSSSKFFGISRSERLKSQVVESLAALKM